MQVKKGDRVSLDSSKRMFFFQGDNGINLVAGKNETAVIPDDISDLMLKQIGRAAFFGEIVLGSPPEKMIPVPEDDLLEDLLKKGRNKVADFIHQYKNNKKINNEDKIAKFEKMLELEIEGKNRVSVTANLEKVLASLAGASPVVEESVDTVEIAFTKGTEEEDSE